MVHVRVDLLVSDILIYILVGYLKMVQQAVVVSFLCESMDGNLETVIF